MKKSFLFAALAAMAIFSACSESSSSSNPADPTPTATDPVQDNQKQADPATNPNDPNPAQNPETTVNPQTGDSTITTPTTPGDTGAQAQANPDPSILPATTGCAEGEVPVPVAFPLDKFFDIGEVYKAIQCNEKVVFMVRHGQREPSIGSETPLTEDGAIEAQEMGAKLVGPVDFVYIHSGFVRTYQTVLNAAIGRGQAQMLPDSTVLNFTADTIKQLADGWYLKDKAARDSIQSADSIKNVNVLYSAWVYENKYAEAFYDLEERSQELLNTYIIKDYAQMPKYTLVSSHDQVLMPLTAYATGKQIDLKLYDQSSRRWLYYLAGVAIIINDKNEVRYVAIKGGQYATTQD